MSRVVNPARHYYVKYIPVWCVIGAEYWELAIKKKMLKPMDSFGT